MITHLQKSLWERAKPPSKNVGFSENRFCLENCFFTSRPCMAPRADPQSGKCSYIDPLSYVLFQKLDLYDQTTDFYLMILISTPVFYEKTLLHLEPSGIYFFKNIYSLLRWVRHNSKIGSENDLLNKTCPKNVILQKK